MNQTDQETDETVAKTAPVKTEHEQSPHATIAGTRTAESQETRPDTEGPRRPPLDGTLTEPVDPDATAPLPKGSDATTVASSSRPWSLNQSSSRHRFQILRRHAAGGIGEVFLAQDQELNREVALKEIQSRFADDPSSRARFIIEAEVTGYLDHPGIVPVYSLGQDVDGRPFYAMRFIRGESLREAIRRFHAEPSAGEKSAIDTSRDPKARTAPSRITPESHDFELRRLLGRFVDVCNTIAFAHSRQVLHRDLKPANVMLGPFGETLVVDWGLAKRLRVGARPGRFRDAGRPARLGASPAETAVRFGDGHALVHEPGAVPRASWDVLSPRATSTAWEPRSSCC